MMKQYLNHTSYTSTNELEIASNSSNNFYCEKTIHTIDKNILLIKIRGKNCTTTSSRMMMINDGYNIKTDL